MKKNSIFTLIAATMFAAVVALTGCSGGDSKSEHKSSLANDVVDSISVAIADNFAQARLASAEMPAEADSDPAEALAAQAGSDDAFDFAALTVVDSTMYAVADDNLYIYDQRAGELTTVPAGAPLNAVVYHSGKVYVGGQSLFEVADKSIEPVEVPFNGEITTLFSHGYRLMIGTTEGLFAHSIFGNEGLFEGISVSAITAEDDALWVGTDGQGLYRWNGREFKQRYLYRDTSIFDDVNALDYNHGHLYVGTDEALYIFDGGRWETITTECGLPSNKINAIDASNWVVYIATDGGIRSYFNGDVMPVKKVNDAKATAIRVIGRQLFAGTTDRGLLLKTGPVVTTLVEPKADDQAAPVVVSMNQ